MCAVSQLIGQQLAPGRPESSIIRLLNVKPFLYSSCELSLNKPEPNASCPRILDDHSLEASKNRERDKRSLLLSLQQLRPTHPAALVFVSRLPRQLSPLFSLSSRTCKIFLFVCWLRPTRYLRMIFARAHYHIQVGRRRTRCFSLRECELASWQAVS